MHERTSQLVRVLALSLFVIGETKLLATHR